jgi:hypothetical protein
MNFHSSEISELNPDQGNPCIDNQYDKRKLLIFHQNIRRLCNKTIEIICHFGSESPHFLWLTEHHLSGLEIQYILMVTLLVLIIVEINGGKEVCVYTCKRCYELFGFKCGKL